MTLTIQTSFKTHPLWEFSTLHYQKPEVANACLSLQQRWGFNVNLLLFCCWVADAGMGILERSQLQQAAAAIEPWHQAISLGLRAMRLQLTKVNHLDKFWLKRLKAELLAHELAAEYAEQRLLLLQTANYPVAKLAILERLEHAKINLSHYIKLLNRNLRDQDYQLMAQLLAAIFGAKIQASNLEATPTSTVD